MKIAFRYVSAKSNSILLYLLSEKGAGLMLYETFVGGAYL